MLKFEFLHDPKYGFLMTIFPIFKNYAKSFFVCRLDKKVYELTLTCGL